MVRRMRLPIAAAAAFALAAAGGAVPAALAQAASTQGVSGQASSGPAASQGFSVPGMLMELSIFLPEGAPAFGGGPQGGSPGAGGGLRSLLSSFRDPKLFFDLGQVDTLIPLMQALYQNPFPTPASARKLQAAMDGLLTPAPRAALDRFRAERDRLAARYRQEAAGGGPFQGSPDAGGRSLTPLERRQRMIEAFVALLKQRRKDLAPA